MGRSLRRLLSRFPLKGSSCTTAWPINSWKTSPYTGTCRAAQVLQINVKLTMSLHFSWQLCKTVCLWLMWHVSPPCELPLTCEFPVSLTWHLWHTEYPTARWTNCTIKCLLILHKTPSMGPWSATPTSAPRGKWWVAWLRCFYFIWDDDKCGSA